MRPRQLQFIMITARNSGTTILDFFQSELPVSDFWLIQVSFDHRERERESLTKCIWVERSEVWRPSAMETASTVGPQSTNSMTATATHAFARSLVRSHTWPRHTIDFRRADHPPSSSLSLLSPQFYIRESPIYTLLFYWSLNFIGCDDGADSIWARAKFPRSTDLEYSYLVNWCLHRVQGKCCMLLRKL